MPVTERATERAETDLESVEGSAPAAAEPIAAGAPTVLPASASTLEDPDELHHLPFWTKVALYVVGVLFLLLGIAGLFLPILQGVLFLLIGAAVISVASERVYDAMYRLLHKRPKIWGKIHGFRARVHAKLVRRKPTK